MNEKVIIGLAFALLKAMGVSIAPESVRMLENIVPQIPTKIVEVLTIVNDAIERNADKNDRILEGQKDILAAIADLKLKVDPDAVDDMPHVLEAALTGNLPRDEYLEALTSCRCEGVAKGDRCRRCLKERAA